MNADQVHFIQRDEQLLKQIEFIFGQVVYPRIFTLHHANFQSFQS